MTRWRVVFRSLLFHRRIHLAVLLGVAAATAVLTGALVVGDSVRGSLRHLALDRLGRFDHVLLTEQFFRESLANDLAQQTGFTGPFTAAIPAIILPQITVEKPALDAPARSGGVMLIGCRDDFWDEGGSAIRPEVSPQGDQIVLNEPLANELGVGVGDEVVLRLPRSRAVPADSALGRKTDRIRGLRVRVVDIVPAEGLGRFRIRSNQNLPRNAYVPLETLQRALERQGKVNAILVTGVAEDAAALKAANRDLTALLRPSLEDFGVAVQHVRRLYREPNADHDELAFEYFHVTTDRMLWEPSAEKAAATALADFGGQPVLTYLANTIELASTSSDNTASRSIPYSTISAVDSTDRLGPLIGHDGKSLGRLGDDEIVLNSWAAEQLQAQPGDRVRVVFFEPETAHGVVRERDAVFRLRDIVPLIEPAEPYRRQRPARFDRRPSYANDPDLTPTVEGITDQESIDDWDPPFPFDSRRIQPQDERYWDYHRTTPKAFISLAAGRKLWASRFGETTSFRVAAGPSVTLETLSSSLEQALRANQASLGFEFIPVKADGLEAAKGTTQFNMLFLGFSFFLMAAALMLVALLFRLGIEHRASEIGLLMAVGWRARRTRRLLVVEGLVLSIAGGLVGTLGGVGYARLMLAGLRSWWLEAVVTPFMTLYVTRVSLLVGCLSGIVVTLLTIVWTTFQLRRVPVRRLLAGQGREAPEVAMSSRRWGRWFRLLLFLVAILLGLMAAGLRGESQAGAFFGCGACVLLATLLWVRQRLAASGRAGHLFSRLDLVGLALRNAGRNPTRSTLTIGLMASACFLIIAISAFRLAPTESGTGGFDLVAESDQPVFANLNDVQGREQLLGQQASVLDGSTVLLLRMRPGDDASCRNLYQAARPRLLGVTREMVEYFDRQNVPHFAWAATAAGPAPDPAVANPWRLLESPDASRGGTVPVVLDKNTALYSLKLYRGVGEEFQVEYERGSVVRFRVVGLLANSILQGSLLIGERALVERFSDVAGYRFFLVRTPEGRLAEVSTALESQLGDQGFDVRNAQRLLSAFLAVQNTYLATFQSLGALGLLLGTFGLVAVQLRNVWERRSEMALLRATGFRRIRVGRLIFLENLVLLAGGLGVGIFAALVAVIPHLAAGGAAVPFGTLAWMLAVVLAVGVVAGSVAVRATLHAPLLAALRGD